MQLSLKTTPSGLPLQGSGAFGQSYNDLSSSRGVWLPRKCKKVKGEEEKITNSRGEEASCQLDLLIQLKVDLITSMAELI